MNPLDFKDDRIIGTINNEPRHAKNVTYRQHISFRESDTVAWMYRENGKMKGNFTACALLKQDTWRAGKHSGRVRPRIRAVVKRAPLRALVRVFGRPSDTPRFVKRT
jgi:hypothetical protein